MSVKIFDVLNGSVADRAGICAGETLISINKNETNDVLDFRFHQINTRLVLKIEDKSGRVRNVKIKKDEYEELGLEFETYLMDKQHSCKNKCIFCFVDQLPKGMRETLYFKDDDTRLSFLFGNYVTLTNITDHEIERIIKMHISPINISVHTTNSDLRVKMMANPNAGKALSVMRRFADAGISINCQLVLCPDINDGEELARSLTDLSSLFPVLESIALVPVGLTCHREGLYPLSPYTEEKAREVIKIADEFGEKFLKERGSRLVYCSDEFFIKANLPLPDYSYYEDFPQLENGVGLIRSMQMDVSRCIEDSEPTNASRPVRFSIATGVDAAPFIRSEVERILKVFPSMEAHIYPIENNFFGHTITVTGLITATDIIAQLKGKELGEALLLPDVMLRHEKDKFLDDKTVSFVEAALNTKVIIATADGEGLYNAVASMQSFGKEED
ncbi:MAG: DUF512 domain-containing protein [Oscillospiraceae bacterium]|nr:DUF512 domain-containing protein [Oscillospiraceae bacterium]